jgi:predicted Kef-type K+ transport protein
MITSLFIGIALTFSSTIVIVKLLNDKDEEESMYGKVAIGVLIVQDLVVMLVLMLVAAYG